MQLTGLLPHLKALTILRWQIEPTRLVISVASRTRQVRCPSCAVASASVHSHYTRSVADLPMGNRAVVLQVLVRRFRCRSPNCPQHTFAEEFPAVVARYGRCSTLLQDLLNDIGITLGGRPGARFSGRHQLPTSRTTLIRLVRRLPLPPIPSPLVLAIDDFALRRRHHYGTLVVDLERHQLLDLWPERTAGPLIDWLRERSDPPQVICRDRAGAYAEAARQAAPEAQQVADRFHLVRNAGQLLERVLVRHARAIRALSISHAPAVAALSRPREESTDLERSPDDPRAPLLSCGVATRRTRRLACYQQVMALYHVGSSLTAIAQQVGLSRPTVRNYVRAGTFPEWAPRRTLLRTGSSDTAYLHQRWTQGCRDATRLWSELREQGFTGSLRMVQRAVRAWRLQPAIPEEEVDADQIRTTEGLVLAAPAPALQPQTYHSAPHPLSPKQAAWLLQRPPESLNAVEHLLRKNILALSAEIREAAEAVAGFRQVLRTQAPEWLGIWLQAAQTSSIPELRAFAAHLRRDEDAVRAAAMLRWNSSQIEGHVTKVKLLKRLMFGRANFDLLKRRVLLAG